MIKLLTSGVARLRKNRMFWLLTIFSVALALLMICTRYSDMKKYGDTIEIEQLMFNYGTIIGIVIAIFTSLFLGAEYSDGTLRNKIIIGHKRLHIYASNLCITFIASLFSYVLLIIVVLLIGVPLFGWITMSFPMLLKTLGCIFVTVIAYSAIFTFIAMLISNKTVTAIVSIMLSFGLMMAALSCYSIIEEPEYIPSATTTNQETLEFEVIQEPNPKYPSETKRKVCQTMLDINPTGQMHQLAGRTSPNLKILPVWSLGILLVFTTAGILLFDKKDLN